MLVASGVFGDVASRTESGGLNWVARTALACRTKLDEWNGALSATLELARGGVEDVCGKVDGKVVNDERSGVTRVRRGLEDQIATDVVATLTGGVYQVEGNVNLEVCTREECIGQWSATGCGGDGELSERYAQFRR